MTDDAVEKIVTVLEGMGYVITSENPAQIIGVRQVFPQRTDLTDCEQQEELDTCILLGVYSCQVSSTYLPGGKIRTVVSELREYEA